MGKLKFNQKEICAWIAKIIENPKIKNMSYCKDGVAFCQLINKIKPGSIKKINKGSYASDHKKNHENFVKVIQGEYDVQNSFTSEDVYSFAKRDKVLATLIEFNDNLKNEGEWEGPFIEKLKKSGGPVLSLLDAKQQEVGKKNVTFDRVKHNIIRNTDEETTLYNKKFDD